jgi:hypothetical protein
MSAQTEERNQQIITARESGASTAAIAKRFSLTPARICQIAPMRRSQRQIPTHLVAADPQEMAAARGHLAEFLQRKIVEARTEASDVTEAIAVAVQNGWNCSALDRQDQRLKSRVMFYEKALAVVDAGYTLIPNFPLSIFAVRVNRKTPLKRTAFAESSYRETDAFIPDEKAKALAAGEGRYVSPSQLVHRENFTEQKEGKTVKWTQAAWPVEFDSLEFPLVAASPVVMEAAARAMALKLFDEIGICPPQSQPDPLIIGRIVMKRQQGWREPKSLSFLIAWHLDLRTL